MKKILFITQLYPFSLSGGTWKSWNVINGLLQSGFGVDICCFKDEIFPYKEINKKNLRIFSLRKSLVGIQLKNIPNLFLLTINNGTPWRIGKYFDKRLSRLIELLQNKNQYEFSIVEIGSSLQYIPFLKSKRIIYIEQNIENEIAWRRYKVSEVFLRLFWYLEYLLTKRYEQKYISLVDEVWAISGRDRERLKKLTKLPVFTLPIGLSNRRRIKLAKEVEHIVFTGLLSWQENRVGLLWFIKNVWVTVHRQHPNLKLLIFGAGATNKLKNDLGSEGVEFKGFVSDFERPMRELSPNSIAIAPVFSGSGIKVKILLYAEHRLPIITTSVGAEGILFKSVKVCDDADDWISTINSLLNNLQERTDVIRRQSMELGKYYKNMELKKFLIKRLQ